jgi:hypothetical protein
MKFTVVWTRAVQNELARIWMNASDRADVTAASHGIDSLLRRDPISVGVPRSGSARVLLVAPLAVTYRVSEADCMVHVLDIWRIQ